MSVFYGPRHWANVPGVQYPDDGVSGRAEPLVAAVAFLGLLGRLKGLISD